MPTTITSRPKPSRRRVEEPEIRRREILAAAQRALKSASYHDLKMDDIARTAGISKGLLYFYFKDKEELFAEVAKDLLRGLAGCSERICEAGTPRKVLEAWIGNLLSFGEEHKEFAGQYIPEHLLMGPRGGEIRKAYEATVALLAGHMKAGMECGIFRKHDPRVSAELLLEIIAFYTVGKYARGRFPKPLPSYAPEIAEFVMNGWGRRSHA